MNTDQKLKKELSSMVKTARFYKQLTQAELAKLMRTKQPSIARSERDGFTVELAEKALNAMGYQLAFHHISYGTRQSYSTSFLGGME